MTTTLRHNQKDRLVRPDSRIQPDDKDRRLWMPSLFLANGLPFSMAVLVMVMYKRFGTDNGELVFNVALAFLPWVLRPLADRLVRSSGIAPKMWMLCAGLISWLSLLLLAFSITSSTWDIDGMYLLMAASIGGAIHASATELYYVPRALSATKGQSGRMHILLRCAATMLCTGVFAMLAGNLEVVTRSVRYSWSVVFYAMAALFLLLWLYNSWALPDVESSCVLRLPADRTTLTAHPASSFPDAKTTLFLFLFLLPEALLCSVSALFVIDARHNGGLGLSPQEFGLVQGTLGVIGTAAGTLLCNLSIERRGFHVTRMLTVGTVMLHTIIYVLISHILPSDLWIVGFSILIGSMASGFGLSSFLHHFLHIDESSSIRHSLTMAIVSVALILPGMFSGYLLDLIGYRQFFIVAAAFATFTFLLTPFINTDAASTGRSAD